MLAHTHHRISLRNELKSGIHIMLEIMESHTLKSVFLPHALLLLYIKLTLLLCCTC